MPIFRRFAAALALALGAAAVAAQPAPPPAAWTPRPGEITDPVECQGFPGQSYALYLPADYTPARRWGVLYAFDARQRGRLVAERFRAAAERLGVVVVSSNNSRSDEEVDPNPAAMRAMWDDSHARFAIDPARVYATGFSGGARAASVLATVRKGEVAGVIGVGGGFPYNWPPTAQTTFAFYGLAGTRDFNHGELRDLDARLAELGVAHAFDVFDGRHEWAPPAALGQALAWLEIGGMARGVVARREAVIEEEWRAVLARAAAREPQDPVAALRILREAVALFRPLRAVDAAATAAARIEASAVYRDAAALQLRVERELAEYLAQAKARLVELLREDPSTVPLARALNRLEVPRRRRLAAEAPEAYERDAANRALESLHGQTSFYLPRDFERRGDHARAALVLAIAADLHPEYASNWYRLARMRSLAGEQRGALDALRRALAAGFEDRAGAASDPAFARIRDRKEFRELVLPAD